MSYEEYRAAKCTLLLGFNGTGKTTFLRNMLRLMVEQANERGQRLKVLIVTPDDVEWQEFEENNLATPDDFVFNGIMRHIWQDDYTLERLTMFNSGVIVFDDCKTYFGDILPQEVVNFFIRRRQRMLDIFFVGHGFTTIPPKAFTYYSDAILWQTVDNIDRRKNCITNFDYFKKKQQEVNKIAARGGKYRHYHVHIRNTDIA